MPVLVAALARDLDIVRPLMMRLKEGGGELRCYLEDDDYELRSIGCKIAVGDLEDADTLQGALTNVHTFIPILSDPWPEFDLSIEKRFMGFAETAVSLTEADIVEQVIAPVAGVASERSLGPLDAIASRFAASSNCCVMRTGFTWGPGRPLERASRSLHPSMKVSALSVDDLVSALVAADDREQIHGTLELGGAVYEIGAIARSNGDESLSYRSTYLSEVDELTLGSSGADELGIPIHPIV